MKIDKYIYHRTSYEKLALILSSDKLIKGSRADWDFERVSSSKSDNRHEFGDVCLVFDREDLEEDYELIDYDYSNSCEQYRNEKEVYCKEDIVGLEYYLVRIDFDK